jgi:NAD(P)-dependent dehydrogenase (short-subunit alcohol dehydrogenase family)
MTRSETRPDGLPIAVVTGGARGIGAQTVRALVAAGFAVEFTYLRSAEAAAEVVADCAGHAHASQVDGREPDQVRRFCDGISAAGRVRVLVNNQGTTVDQLVRDLAWQDLRALLDGNLGSAVNFTVALLPHLVRARRGDIVFISSQAHHNARPGNVLYGVSKAALTRFGLGVAQEYARFNVYANIVEPGFVDTDLTGALLDDERRRRLRREIPTKRLTTPQDVANAVVSLACRSTELIGAVLPVAGGAQL